MTAPAPFTDDELNALADDALPPARAREVQSAIDADPSSMAATRVLAYRRQNAALRDAFDPWLAESVPAALIAAASPPQQRRRRWLTRAWRWSLVGIAASLVLGVTIGWLVRGVQLENAGTPTTFARQAAFAHALYASDANRPVEIGATEEKRLVTWLSKRLGITLTAPDLTGVGFSLVGGRLVAGNEKPTALFMYENAAKERLTLQLRRERSSGPEQEAAFRYAVENGVGVFYWIDDNCDYAISGKLDPSQLLAIARIVYGQFAALDNKVLR